MAYFKSCERAKSTKTAKSNYQVTVYVLLPCLRDRTATTKGPEGNFVTTGSITVSLRLPNPSQSREIKERSLSPPITPAPSDFSNHIRLRQLFVEHEPGTLGSRCCSPSSPAWCCGSATCVTIRSIERNASTAVRPGKWYNRISTSDFKTIWRNLSSKYRWHKLSLYKYICVPISPLPLSSTLRSTTIMAKGLW